MGNAYEGIEEASVQTKYPFIEEGIHIVRPLNWIARNTRVHGMSDFFDMEVVKTSNPAVTPGAHRSRMRILKRDGSLSEVKQRTQACFAALGSPVELSQITAEVLGSIVEKNGSVFTDIYLKLECSQVKTKTGGAFTAVIYSVPTDADLDGIR